MQRKATLYVDIDDTIIAQILPGSGFDLRPCVVTHLTVLSRLFDCCWLTSWPFVDPSPNAASISSLIRCLYGAVIHQNFRFAKWDPDHPDGKAGFVLHPNGPEDWYWLEAPIPQGEREALARAGQLHRYISVEPTGAWAFLDAVNQLFRITGTTAADIRHAQGRPEWFNRRTLDSTT